MHLPLLILISLLPSTRAVHMTLTPISTDGTACPPGSSTTYSMLTPNEATERTALWQSINPFRPLIGPGIPISENTRTCTIVQNITFSEPGWKAWVNVWGMDVAGYAPMIKGEELRLQVWFEWPGAGKTASEGFVVQGPSSPTGRFERHSDKADDNESPSLCGGGTLKTTFRSRMLSNGAKPGGGGLEPEPEPGLEVYKFLTSVQIGQC